jgi:hypothetical protein
VGYAPVEVVVVEEEEEEEEDGGAMPVGTEATCCSVRKAMRNRCGVCAVRVQCALLTMRAVFYNLAECTN